MARQHHRGGRRPLQKLREDPKIRQDSELICLLFRSVGKGEREEVDTYASVSTVRRTLVGN
jgi:hypothetical protein